MNLRTLRKRCEARLETVNLPVPFTAKAFCAELAARIERPIILSRIAADGNPYGSWIRTDSCDYIFYDAQTTPLHQGHIILHEACHILCDHRGVQLPGNDMVSFLISGVSRRTIQRMMERNTYTSEEEQEAELLATLISRRAAMENLQAASGLQRNMPVPLERLTASLEGPAGVH